VIAWRRSVASARRVLKSNAKSCAGSGNGSVLAAFAGCHVGPLTLFDRLAANLEQHPAPTLARCVDSPRTGARTAIFAGWRR